MPVLDHATRLIRSGFHSVTQRVIVITGIGMALSILVDVLIAVRLGTSVAADALIIALTLPRMMEIIVREGAKFSLVTVFVEKRSSISHEESEAFVSAVLNLFLSAGVLITLLLYLSTKQVIAVLAPGFTLEVRELAARSFRAVLPMMIFALGAVVLWVYLNSIKRFTEAAIRNAIVPLIVIVTMVIFWRNSGFGYWVAWAYSIGFLLLFVLLGTLTSSQIGFQHSFRIWPSRTVLKVVFYSMAFPLLGFGVTQASRAVERMLATLVTAGGVASYYFAFRLVSGAQSLIGVPVATVALPAITEHDLLGEREKFDAALKRRLWYTLLLSVPISLVFITLNRPVVRLLYGWGAFGAGSIQQTSSILQILGIGVVFLSFIPVLNAGLYARRLYSWVFSGMFFAGTVDVLLAWWWSKRFGLQGIAYAAAVSAVATCLVLAFLIRRSGRLAESKAK